MLETVKRLVAPFAKGSAVLAALLAFGGAISASAAAGETLRVETESGVIVGAQEGEVAVFRGIPYAAPPIGDRRWRAAEAHPGWSEPRPAEAFGPACPQPERPGRKLDLPGESEDCLTLNIWTSAMSGEKAPVMVWIHGGAFRFGAGSLPLYDGTRFARSGVVLVTFNYRLGRLGFFAHPALKEETGGLANFALSDQVRALRWVRDNIAAFGGDAENVAVFGESAGGASVAYLLTSPAAEGLFDKAIMQSGGGRQRAAAAWRGAGATGPTLEDRGLAWAKRRSLPASASAADLRAVPLGDVLEEGAGVGGIGAVAPVVDGTLVREQLGMAFAAGRQHRVPLLIGANSYEASLMTSFRLSAADVLSGLGSRRQEAEAAYDARGRKLDEEAFAREVFGDAAFVAPARAVARQVAASGAPAWIYHFDYTRPRGKAPGAAHGLEIPFVFGTLDRLGGRALSALVIGKKEKALSENMHAAWVSFAKAGAPALAGGPAWPKASGSAETTMVFRRDGAALERDFLAARLDFQDALYAEETR